MLSWLPAPPQADLAYRTDVWVWTPIVSLRDAALVAVFAVALFTLRWVLTAALYRPLVAYFGVKKRAVRGKLMENMWYVCYYPSMIAGQRPLSVASTAQGACAAVAASILWGHEFFPWRALGFWTNFPSYGDWAKQPLWCVGV